MENLIYLKIWITILSVIVAIWGYSAIRMNSDKPTNIDWFKIAKISGVVMFLFIVIPFLIGIWYLDI